VPPPRRKLLRPIDPQIALRLRRSRAGRWNRLRGLDRRATVRHANVCGCLKPVPAPTTSSGWRPARCLVIQGVSTPLLINTRGGSKSATGVRGMILKLDLPGAVGDHGGRVCPGSVRVTRDTLGIGVTTGDQGKIDRSGWSGLERWPRQHPRCAGDRKTRKGFAGRPSPPRFRHMWKAWTLKPVADTIAEPVLDIMA
jgi:hypothetical protein